MHAWMCDGSTMRAPWLACRRIRPAYWQVACIAVIAPLAGTFMDTATLATCTRNFPTERGTVIGLIKAAIGALWVPCFLHSVLQVCVVFRQHFAWLCGQ